MEIIRIPKERVGALRLAKQEIEKRYGVEIILGGEGEVELKGESVWTYLAKDVVHAIGRGFEPGEAMKLFRENYSFYLIDLGEHFSTKNALRRVKGRIIGEKGRVKGEIEKATDSSIEVYGHTVGIIAPSDAMEYAKEAIRMIIEGAPHTTVINYLGRIRENLMFSRLKGGKGD
ncbi:MAG: KH domain-containing protein [Candidatus Micrarchaeota archaeon]